VSNAQGLEKIIVEVYYVADSIDASSVAGDGIKENSITYRIYVDMKPGYTLQSVYGAPGHPLVIGTSTHFFNHSIHGHYIPNLVMDPFLSGGTLMLDSWIGMGAASQQKYGILKTNDDTLLHVNNLSKPLLLQAEHPLAGVPLKTRDGLKKPETGLPPRVTQIGLDALLQNLFKAPQNTGYTFKTENGGWGCLGGAQGIDAKENMVLIAQLTTDGDLYVELNLQIGTPDGLVEQYVAGNPAEKEILFPDLIIRRKAFDMLNN
jgi:hypothetical protein